MVSTKRTGSGPITLTLREVLEGARRAEERVSRRPEWKRKLSPSTWPESSGIPSSTGEETKPTDSEPITLNLQQVLEGAARAEEIVSRWPEWMRDLSPSTWSERGDGTGSDCDDGR
jgi:hypothetical protein